MVFPVPVNGSVYDSMHVLVSYLDYIFKAFIHLK
jgi:hypothetical protein